MNFRAVWTICWSLKSKIEMEGGKRRKNWKKSEKVGKKSQEKGGEKEEKRWKKVRKNIEKILKQFSFEYYYGNRRELSICCLKNGNSLLKSVILALIRGENSSIRDGVTIWWRGMSWDMGTLHHVISVEIVC